MCIIHLSVIIVKLFFMKILLNIAFFLTAYGHWGIINGGVVLTDGG